MLIYQRVTSLFRWESNGQNDQTAGIKTTIRHRPARLMQWNDPRLGNGNGHMWQTTEVTKNGSGIMTLN